MGDSRYDVLDLGIRGELDLLLDRARRLAPGSGGATVFLAGDDGSGATALLDAVAGEIAGERGGPRVISGTFESGEYLALTRDEGFARARLLAEGVIGVGGPFIPLVAQVLAVSNGAKKVVDALASKSVQAHPLDLVPEVLRVAARAEGPLVCLIDAADRSERGWWADLMLNLSRQIVLDLPLLLVFALEGPAKLGPQDPAEPAGLFVAKQLVGEGAAVYRPMPRHSAGQFEAWAGGTTRALADLVTEITGGRASWSAQIWEEWRASGTVREADGVWSLTEADSISTLGAVGRLQSRRLRAALGEDLPALSLAQELLAVAALEGREFTADGLALVIGRDADEVIDFLDERLGGEAEGGIVEELPTLTVVDQDGRRHLRRYRFALSLDYLFCHHYGIPGAEQRAARALALAQTLHDFYGAESPRVARALADLAEMGGDREAAREFRHMQYVTSDRMTAVVRAKAAMGLPLTAGQNERNRAAELLVAGAQALYSFGPWSEGLAFSEKAAGLTDIVVHEATALYYAAWFCSQSGDVRKARRYLVRALDGFESRNERAGIGNALHQLANVDMVEGRYAEAEAGYLKALEIREALGDRELQARVHEALGDLRKRCEDPVRAREDYRLASSICLEIDDRISWASTRWRVAELDYEAERYEECRAPLDEVLAVMREHGDRHNTVPVLRLLAMVEFEMERPERARDAAALAHAITREAEMDEGAASLFQVGQAEQALGNEAAARAAFEEVLADSEGRDDLALHARMALGTLAMEEEKFDAARRHLDKAVRLAVDQRNRWIEGECRRLLGDLLVEQGSWQKARRSYLLALPLKREQGPGLAYTLYGLGCANYELEDYDDARRYLQEALPLLAEEGARDLEASTTTYLGLLAGYDGDGADCRRWLNRALHIRREEGDGRAEADILGFLAEIEHL